MTLLSYEATSYFSYYCVTQRHSGILLYLQQYRVQWGSCFRTVRELTFQWFSNHLLQLDYSQQQQQ